MSGIEGIDSGTSYIIEDAVRDLKNSACASALNIYSKGTHIDFGTLECEMEWYKTARNAVCGNDIVAIIIGFCLEDEGAINEGIQSEGKVSLSFNVIR